MRTRTSFLLKMSLCSLIFGISTNLIAQKTKNRAGISPTDWKLGVALYTFSNMSFVEQLNYADSSGVKFIEGFTFAKAGAELKDSLLMNLSPSGIAFLKTKIAEKGLKMESIYITGGKKVENWKRDFELAKRFGVKYVTAEPPQNMWDSVDSLAKVYGIKVALHNHWNGNSIYWHPDSTLAAIKGHASFGACPDLGHYPKSGINPVDAVKKLDGKIIGMHLKDIAAYDNPKIQDVLVGTGIVDFPAVFAELNRQKFEGNINIERDTKEKPNNLESVKKTVKYYYKLLDGLE
jgi:L-ribulose-5-phosphate 3-epimerase